MRYPDAPDDLNSTARPATFGAKPFEGTAEDSVSVGEIWQSQSRRSFRGLAGELIPNFHR